MNLFLRLRRPVSPSLHEEDTKALLAAADSQQVFGALFLLRVFS